MKPKFFEWAQWWETINIWADGLARCCRHRFDSLSPFWLPFSPLSSLSLLSFKALTYPFSLILPLPYPSRPLQSELLTVCTDLSFKCHHEAGYCEPAGCSEQLNSKWAVWVNGCNTEHELGRKPATKVQDMDGRSRQRLRLCGCERLRHEACAERSALNGYVDASDWDTKLVPKGLPWTNRLAEAGSVMCPKGLPWNPKSTVTVMQRLTFVSALSQTSQRSCEECSCLCCYSPVPSMAGSTPWRKIRTYSTETASCIND